MNDNLIIFLCVYVSFLHFAGCISLIFATDGKVSEHLANPVGFVFASIIWPLLCLHQSYKTMTEKKGD